MTISSPSGTLSLGSRAGATFFSGAIDNLRIFNFAIGAQHVQQVIAGLFFDFSVLLSSS